MTSALNKTGATRFSYLFAFFWIAALIGVAGYGYLLYHMRVVTDEKRKELSAIADLKAGQIKQWRHDCLTDAEVIFSNAMLAHRLNEYLEGGETSEIREEFRSWLTSMKNNADFSRALLIGANGRVICSASDDTGPLTGHLLSMIAEAIQQKKVVFSDFHQDAPSGGIHLNLIIPLVHGNGSKSRCLGALALEIDPHTFLYPLLQSWPSPSKTAETILVERDGDDVLILNDLRFQKNTALVLRRPISQQDMPVVRAVLEPDGLFSGTDYHGATVLTATRHIPDSPWVILTKVDTSEIFAPVRLRAWFVVTICSMIVVAAGLGVYLWWMRKKEDNLRLRYEAELKYNADLRQAETALQEAHHQLEQRVIERTTELTNTNARLKHEITERKQLERELLDAKKLEAVGQLAGGVAHEVRNPLNAILSITEALFKEKVIEDNPDFEPYILHIRAQVRRLAHLMNDLLDLGKPIPFSSLQPVSLRELCKETITLWESTNTQKRQVRLLAENEPEDPYVMADTGKLQQVIINLLDNAAQHCPEECEIQIRVDVPGECGPSDGMAVVRIRDTGKGISPDKIARIFDPFFTDRKGGTGLGLALVKHYIEHMGGDVRLRNNDPPPGCTAEVRIPLARKELE